MPPRRGSRQLLDWRSLSVGLSSGRSRGDEGESESKREWRRQRRSPRLRSTSSTISSPGSTSTTWSALRRSPGSGGAAGSRFPRWTSPTAPGSPPLTSMRLLLRRGTTPVVAFRLLALDPSWGARGYIDDWLLYLSRRGVQDLALGFSSRCGFVQMHSCLFSCRKLTRLSLMSCRIPPAPAGFAGFPNLKALRLEGVIVEKGAGHAGGEFAAPVLEEAEFVLVILPGDGSCAEQEWTIRAPNLRKLSIFGRPNGEPPAA